MRHPLEDSRTVEVRVRSMQKGPRASLINSTRPRNVVDSQILHRLTLMYVISLWKFKMINWTKTFTSSRMVCHEEVISSASVVATLLSPTLWTRALSFCRCVSFSVVLSETASRSSCKICSLIWCSSSSNLAWASNSSCSRSRRRLKERDSSMQSASPNNGSIRLIVQIFHRTIYNALLVYQCLTSVKLLMVQYAYWFKVWWTKVRNHWADLTVF